MRISALLLLLFGLKCFDSTGQTDDSPAFLNATIDANLSIHLLVGKKPNVSGTVTGFKIYFTKDADLTSDEFRNWEQEEVLSDRDFYRITLSAKKYNIQPQTLYRIRATVFLHNVESAATSVVVVDTRNAAPKAPLIVSTKVLANSSVLVDFVQGEDVSTSANYALEFKFATEENWNKVNFDGDGSGKMMLTDVEPNKTYEIRMYVVGSSVPGAMSNSATFTTDSAELATVSLTPPDADWAMDPETSASLQVRCDVTSSTPANVFWKVNGDRVSVDNSFYTVTNSVHNGHVESTIRAKSRTRSATFSCVASNSAGDSQKDLKVVIKGPGSPPSAITLTSERNGYTISWQPPSQPNGNVTKYVVYYTLNREDPLSDWRKLDLDGSEKFVRVMADTEESFYGRVQAATNLGPGIISDIVAVERDTQPISVDIEFKGEVGSEVHIVDPSEPLLFRCMAKGKPRPSLAFALSDRKNASTVVVDIWQRLQANFVSGVSMAMYNFSTLTSKFAHCRAKNSAGSNYSTIEIRVEKPGDAPTNVRVVNVNSLDATVVWDNPQFPNLPITNYLVLIAKDVDDDKSAWSTFDTEAKEGQLSRMTFSTTDLDKSTEYFLVVQAKNAAGYGPYSAPITFMTPNGGPDDAPHDVKVEINEANQVVLRWIRPNSTTPITGYSIYYTRDLGLTNDDYSNWQYVEFAGDVLKYKFDHAVGLKPKTFYRVRIAARNEHAIGPVSSTFEFETAYAELPIPTDLSSEVTEDNTVHIRFNAVRDPDDHTKAIEKYKLEVAASEDVLTAQWIPVQPTSLTVDEVSSKVDVVVDGSRLERNRMYWIKTTAVLNNPTRLVQSSKPRWFRTGNGKLVTSVALEGAPIIEKEPNLFEELKVNCVGEGSPAPQVAWAWNNASIVNGTDGWLIFETSDDRKTTSALRRNNIRESGVLGCIASNVEGNASAIAEVRVLGPGSPPANLQAIAYRNQINVSWEEPVLPNGDIMKYIVYYALRGDDDLSDWEKFETTDLESNIDAKAPTTRHFVKVQAVSNRGPGIISDSVGCDSDLLYEPITLQLFADNIVDFEAEPNQLVNIRCTGKGEPLPDLYYSFGQGDIKFEEVRFVDGSFEADAPPPRSPNNFTVTCRAVNKYENVTIAKKVIVRRPGEAPANVTWSFSDDDDSLFIDWLPVRFPNGLKLHYNLYLSNFITQVSGPPVKIPEIPPNVNMSLRISAENEHGEGEKSSTQIILTPNGGPKTAPLLTSLHAQDKKVHIQWDPPLKTNTPIQNYTIYYHKADDGDREQRVWNKMTVAGNKTSTVLGETLKLEEEVTYELKMSATNAKHEGPATKVYTFTLRTWDDEVDNVTAVVINSTVFVNVSDYPFKKYKVVFVAPQTEAGPSQEVDVTDGFVVLPLPDNFDLASKHQLKLAGIRNGHVGKLSEPIDLVPSEDGLPPAFTRSSIAAPPGQDDATVTPDRRNLVREPPL